MEGLVLSGKYPGGVQELSPIFLRFERGLFVWPGKTAAGLNVHVSSSMFIARRTKALSMWFPRHVKERALVNG